jgi:DeoR/GlpR family transcriptional regulator of sugar metabolism
MQKPVAASARESSARYNNGTRRSPAWPLAAERREVLRRLFAGRVHLSIGEIQAELLASLATIRRDLMALERQGIVSRVHGGAVACLMTESAAPTPSAKE